MNIISQKINYIILLIFLGAITACSNDDNNHTRTSQDYFPLHISSDWTYNVETNDNTNPPTTTIDIVTVDETAIVNSKDYFGMSSNPEASGTMTQLFDQNYFRTEPGKLFTEGDFTLPLSNFGGTDIVIELNDIKLIDESETNGTVLATQSGTTTQNIGGYDLDIQYTFKTVQKSALNNHAVDNTTFENITSSDIILSIKVSTIVNIGVPITITLLDTQDVLTINNFYANEIGLIDSNSVFTYQLEDLSALPITIPIPETATITTTQKITAYTIAE